MQSRVDALGLFRNQSITMLSSNSPSTVPFLRFLGAVPPVPLFCSPLSSAFRFCECEWGFVAPAGLPAVVDVCASGLPERPVLGGSPGAFGLVALFATNECPFCVGVGDVGRDPEAPGGDAFTWLFACPGTPPLDVLGCCDPGRGGGA